VIAVPDPEPGALSQAFYVAPEARAACETRKMRKRALDGDPYNDVASVTLMRSVGEGVRMLTDVDVDCRNYFVTRLRSDDLPALQRGGVQPVPSVDRNYVTGPAASAQPAAGTPASQVRRQHRIQSGETLSIIAQEHCTSWQALARRNGIADPSRVSAGTVLILPEGSC
jgi:nucleoid-associated protein YgaU